MAKKANLGRQIQSVLLPHFGKIVKGTSLLTVAGRGEVLVVHEKGLIVHMDEKPEDDYYIKFRDLRKLVIRTIEPPVLSPPSEVDKIIFPN